MFLTKVIWCFNVLILLQASGSVSYATKDFFSSIAGLEELMRTETFLLTHLQSYVDSMTLQLEMLKNEIDKLEKEHTVAANGWEEYLTSPVNAFLLIKRLDKDWKNFGAAIEKDGTRQSFLTALEFSRENLSFPTEDDMIGSAVALSRLQETYQLDVSQIAEGILNGVKYGSAMSWQDCFELAQQMFNLEDFSHAIPWFTESYEKFRTEIFQNSSEAVEFLEKLVHFHEQMGNFKVALDLNNEILKLEPNKKNFLNFKKHLETMVEQGHGLVEPAIEAFQLTKNYKIYEQICRREISPKPSEERNLRCRYYHRGVPYRYLMPFKMEELSLEPEPYVLYFHDVISEDEIASIKARAKPNMNRSKVRAADGLSLVVASYRISQSTWIEYKDLQATKKLQLRLADITGLNMDGYEAFQVANYGIGGHYDIHYDFMGKDQAFDAEDGNRIATAMFYLSDVEQGGATSFLNMRRAVQPKKGNLIFWYNLHKDGELDFRTKHAACPVLKGSKWVGNVWIRVRKQMFARPCGLLPDHEVSHPYRKWD